ncbi:hypothetical protein GMMP13_1120023 [Candidatus Magnetomoraceae bacterium gMMP-13]
MMKKYLRVLIVEDSEDDALLLVRHLKRTGYELDFQRVEMPEEMEEALDKKEWDIVIADYSMPYFSAPGALELLKKKKLDLPFIIVSGTIGEETAVTAMKSGAHDYIMKGNMARLIPAIDRELREAEVRKKRRKAEEELIAAHQRLMDIIEFLPDATFVINKNNRVVAWNKAIEEMTGVLKMDIMGKGSYAYMVPFAGEAKPGLVDLVVKNTLAIEPQYDYIQRKDNKLYAEVFFPSLYNGKGVYVSLTALPLIDENGNIVGGIQSIRDITENKRAKEELEQRVIERTAKLKESVEMLKSTQAKLVQSEKMAALGDLVGGVAHEINTPVGIGVTAASHLEEKTRECNALFEFGKLKRSDLETYLKTASSSAEMILSNLRRAASLIQSFKQVAVDRANEVKRIFNLKEYIDDVLLSLRPKLKKTQHRINITCPENIKLNSYPGALSQIVTNLIVNTLIHGFENIDSGEINFDISEERDIILFKYQDNGKGIDPNNLNKIFDPFFTTKRGRGGSGLGMHIVYNLVTQTIGGSIECISTPGKGTCFIIQIPAALLVKN